MEIFCYSATIASDNIFFYVSCNENNIIVTTSKNDERRSENASEFTWGMCLENIVIFSLSLMNLFDFNMKPTPLKKKLGVVLKRIKQFERLGDIELNHSVLLLFLIDFHDFIREWIHQLPSGITDDIIYAIRSTIGLLCTFHIMKNRLNLK
jgi:hypothetical protein